MIRTEDIQQVISSIWASILDLEIEFNRGEPGPGDDILTGCVRYHGEFQGALMVSVSRRLAGELAARMFRKAPDTLTPQEIGDALGELTNMISGNLKPLLPGWGRISLPSTAPGTGRGLLPPESREILRIGARCLGEDMVVVFHSSTDHN